MLKSKIDDTVVSRETLVWEWEDSLLDSIVDTGKTLKQAKKEYTFEDFIADLLNSGEYEIAEKTTRYTLDYMHLVNNGEYDFGLIASGVKSKSTINRILKNRIDTTMQKMRDNDMGYVYMDFGKEFEKADKYGCIAEYYIMEMRTNTLIIKFKIYETEDFQ